MCGTYADNIFRFGGSRGKPYSVSYEEGASEEKAVSVKGGCTVSSSWYMVDKGLVRNCL